MRARTKHEARQLLKLARLHNRVWTGDFRELCRRVAAGGKKELEAEITSCFYDMSRVWEVQE